MQKTCKTFRVSLIKSGINLVEDIKEIGFIFLNGKEQRKSNERLLSSRQRGNVKIFSFREFNNDTDSSCKNIFLILKFEESNAFSIKFSEIFGEERIHCSERLHERTFFLEVYFFNNMHNLYFLFF